MLYNAKATAANVTKLNQDLLYVKEAFVGKGRYEKRMLIHGRARSALMTRKSAHMKVCGRRLPIDGDQDIRSFFFVFSFSLDLVGRAHARSAGTVHSPSHEANAQTSGKATITECQLGLETGLQLCAFQ